MSALLNLSVVFEMILVNLSVVDNCAHRNYSRIKTYSVIFCFTVFIVSCSYFCLIHGSGFGNGNGIFVLIGFVYLLPLQILYKESIQQILSILCSSWIYTMMAFSLSVHAGKFFPPQYFVLSVLIIQTVLYVVTVRFFLLWVKSRLLYLLKNISPKVNSYLVYNSLIWFGVIIVINVSFIDTPPSPVKIAALLFLSVCAWLSYALLYMLVKSSRDVKNLKEIIYVDHLTGIRNRGGLFYDVEALIKKKTEFFLIYIDLDYFKSINDQYGHLIGDEYLCFFVNHVNKLLHDAGSLYRMSGDEFICIFTDENPEGFINRVLNFEAKLPHTGIRFLGCSVGYACYPSDACSLDGLISIADKRMYEKKHNRMMKQ